MKAILILLFTLISITVNSQVNKNSELFKTLKANDSILFYEGLNKCNIDIMVTLISDDFEFYHDIGGIDKSKDAFINNIKNGPCNSGTLENKRALIKGSLEVYPLYENKKLYGAIQSGKHRFGNTIAKFTHLWILTNNEWKITRVLSYNH